MNNITRLEAIEDSVGGLYLAVFVGPTCTHLFSDFDPAGLYGSTLREEISFALEYGVGDCYDNSEDPEADYEDLMPEYGAATVIADWDIVGGLRIYPESMGNAGLRWAELDGQE
jgi:hypothetical protein